MWWLACWWIHHLSSLHLPLKFPISPLSTFCQQRLSAPTYQGRCRACKACKECQFRTNLLTAKENAEYEVICQNLTHDKVTQSWSTKYPFIVDPSVLKDNLGQTLACMKRLAKQKKLAKFNLAFQEIVDMGGIPGADGQGAGPVVRANQLH